MEPVIVSLEKFNEQELSDFINSMERLSGKAIKVIARWELRCEDPQMQQALAAIFHAQPTGEPTAPRSAGRSRKRKNLSFCSQARRSRCAAGSCWIAIAR